MSPARRDFEQWVRDNLKTHDFSGYDAGHDVWVYRNNIIQLAWRCWCDSRHALKGEKK
jgi:hypothetical protein